MSEERIFENKGRICKLLLSKGQIRILEYIEDNGPVILESTYNALGIPKATASYHVNRLKYLGLIREIGVKGREKPLELTELGDAVLRLLRGESISDKQRITITALGLVAALGIKMLNDEELKKVIELFKNVLEEGKRPEPKTLFNIVV